MAASASVGLNFRAPRTWSGRCMRNSETPAGFKPKRWPKKVPNALPKRQGVPNPTFEPVKNTRTWASAGMLHPTFKPYTDTIITAPSAALPKRRNTNGVPHPTFEPLRNTSTRASATHAKRHPDEAKVNRAVDGKWMAASASVGLNFRAPRTWSGRCMRNSETPAGFKPKRWPKKVPNATPRVCLTRPSNPLKTLGPEPRLVCFIQRSNPIYDTITAPLGSTSKTAKHHGVPHPTFEPLRNTSTRASATHAKRHPDEEKVITVQWTASEWQLRPRLAWTSGPREHGVDDACETAKPQQDSSPRGGPKRSRMRRQGVPNPTFEPVKNTIGPEPRLVCFIQRSNPIQTLLPHPRQRVQNGKTPRCASPDLRTVEKH